LNPANLTLPTPTGPGSLGSNKPLVINTTIKTGAVYHANTGNWYVSNVNTSNTNPNIFQYGYAGTIPISGDWFGNGGSLPGVYDPSLGMWYLNRNSNSGDSQPI